MNKCYNQITRGDLMKKDNDKLAYYLPIMISLCVCAAGILSLFSIKKRGCDEMRKFHHSFSSFQNSFEFTMQHIAKKSIQ